MVSLTQLFVPAVHTDLPNSVLSHVNPYRSLSLPSTGQLSARFEPMQLQFLNGGAHIQLFFSRHPPNPPSNLSWELGTVTEALLEYSWPQLSVFNYAASIPPAKDLFIYDYPVDVVNIATTCARPSP